MQIDGSEEVEELHTMLWEFRKVLVDHVEGALEHILHDDRYLVFHKGL
jgi:hypothetical protein